jgi:type IV pilus assembly protein PilA
VAATKNVAGITLNAATGQIIITTTANAGNGTLSLNPNVAGAILPVGTAAFTPTSGAMTWHCSAAGATGNVGQTVGTLPAKYAPSECR